MKRRDSFSAGMLVTFGVLTALALTGAVVYYGIREKVWTDFKLQDDKAAETTSQARQMALPQLKRHGIMALSDDAKAFDDSGFTTLAGTGRDKSGKLKPLFVQFRVARFGHDVQWKIEAINIDGSEVYKAPD